MASKHSQDFIIVTQLQTFDERTIKKLKKNEETKILVEWIKRIGDSKFCRQMKNQGFEILVQRSGLGARKTRLMELSAC